MTVDERDGERAGRERDRRGETGGRTEQEKGRGGELKGERKIERERRGEKVRARDNILVMHCVQCILH